MATQPYTQTPSFLPGATYKQRSGLPTDHSQPRLVYFITRTPSGLPVPLIPADELPFNVKLHNVSRVLQPEDTYGLQYVGTSPYTGTVFKLDSAATSSPMQRSNSQPPHEPGHSRSQSSTPSKQFLAPDALVRQAHANSGAYAANSNNHHLTSARPSETATTWRRSDPINPTSTQSVIDAILRSEAGAETASRIGYRSSRDTPPPPSGIMPDQDKKVFCTHWIMTGDCKFVQQGCRYKHEMPSEAKLKELGIRHTPRWWQEQNAAIKLGGARGLTTVVGAAVKPLEMLSKGKKDGEGDGESSDEEEEVVVDVVRQKSPVKDYVVSKQMIKSAGPASKSPPNQPRPVTQQQPIKGEEDDDSILRKLSTASDLIDFTTTRPAVVVPTPSTPTSNTSPTSPLPTTTNPPKTITNPSKHLVFVPAGESPKDHILAAMKKRERATRSKTSSPLPTSSPTATHTAVTDSSSACPPAVHKYKVNRLVDLTRTPAASKARCGRVKRAAAGPSSSSPLRSPASTSSSPLRSSASTSARSAAAAAAAPSVSGTAASGK